jgi:hypothetical protein
MLPAAELRVAGHPIGLLAEEDFLRMLPAKVGPVHSCPSGKSSAGAWLALMIGPVRADPS